MYGEGSFTFSHGARYSGEWRDGERDGKGKFSFPNGEVTSFNAPGQSAVLRGKLSQNCQNQSDFGMIRNFFSPSRIRVQKQ